MTFRHLPLLLAWLAFPSAVFAHRLDEYLQATLVAVEPAETRLHINLTPGVAVAELVLGLIDRNRDGTISTNESAAYAELVKRDLVVRLDRRNVELKLAALHTPDPAVLRAGWGIIRMEFSVMPSVLAAGPHTLTLENRHLPAASVYLFNAARPGSASVQIKGQSRNENQSTGEIAFDFHPTPSASLTVGIVVSIAALFALLFASVWQVRRKQNKGDQKMEIKRNGSQPSGKGPADWFTGTVRIDPLFQANAPARALGASVTFEPGARTAWHTHPLGQTLIVTNGCGRAQRWGGPIEEIRPGDVVWFPPGEKHWHGAAPTTAMTHIAIQEQLEGKVVDWMEQVSGEQHQG